MTRAQDGLLRQRASTRGEALLQRRPGAFKNPQMAAIREFIETEPYRRLDLALMARWTQPQAPS